MFHKSQHKFIQTKIFLLASLLLCSHAVAKDISFNISLPEFILKNASPIIKQIEEKNGLGYESLSYQIKKYNCDPDTVLSPKLLTNKEAYQFNKNLLSEIQKCSKKEPTPTSNQSFNNLLDDKEVYLVIAGESLKSPMSYFGHSSILFLDKKDFYFSPVISILANTENLSAFEQLSKGAFYTIEAKVKAIPLHQILDSYNNRESRNLKFIKLSESIFNKNKLISFFSEKLPENINYNFFFKNCSTYLYEALQYACDCLEKQPKIVAPTTLEKSIYDLNPTPIFELTSLYDQFNQHYISLSNKEKNQVKELFSNNLSDSQIEINKVTETTVLASRLSFETYGKPNSNYEKLLNTYKKDSALLKKTPQEMSSNKFKNDQLKSSSLSLKQSKDKTSLNLSIIDFDHFKQRQHHFISSKLLVGSIEVSEQDDTTKIEHFDLIDIKSITPINFVTKTASWRFNIGTYRNENDHLNAYTRIGVGAATSIGPLTTFLIPSVEISKSTDTYIYSGFELKSDFISFRYEAKSTQNYHINIYRRQNSTIGYEYNFIKEKQNSTHQLALSYYF